MHGHPAREAGTGAALEIRGSAVEGVVRACFRWKVTDIMARRELLDCTLRDGGYVNDWKFGHAQIVEIFERLVSSGVEYIEIGFLDEGRFFDMDRMIFPDMQSADQIYAGLDKGKATVHSRF